MYTPNLLLTYNITSCQSDGSVVLLGGTSGLYTSFDGGETWNIPDLSQIGFPINGSAPFNLAISSDGSTLVASVPFEGIMYSIDEGATWTSNFYCMVTYGDYETSYNSSDFEWGPMAFSKDTLFVVVNNKGIFSSTDEELIDFVSFESFPNITSPSWTALEVSHSGKFIAAAAELEMLYVSNDHGASWDYTGPNDIWNALALTRDGHTLLAATADSFSMEIASYSSSSESSKKSSKKNSKAE